MAYGGVSITQKKEMFRCDICEGTGIISKQVPIEEALVELGVTKEYLEKIFPKYVSIPEEKPLLIFSGGVEYRGYTLRKAGLLSGWEVDRKDWTSLRMDWQEALAFVDRDIRQGIPEPKI